ncbi:MAG TPA: hypothetical protein VN256_13220 [Pyrinomonadaceae bacterium]|nr:hypothetical protein [Pyrinomonadaceae bacterium]
MSVPYGRIVRGVALRVGALRGSVPAGVDISYATLPLTVADFKGGFSLDMVKDAVQLAEEKIVSAIAETGNHPLRRILKSQTANIAHGALIPSTNSTSVPVVGIRGSVVDASDGIVCDEYPLADIRRWVRNANTWRKGSLYAYHIDDNRIFHTRTNVKIDVCTYDAATQRTAIDNNSNMLLPDVLEEALVCGGAAYLGKNEFLSFFEETIRAIRGGLTSVPPKAISEVAA